MSHHHQESSGGHTGSILSTAALGADLNKQSFSKTGDTVGQLAGTMDHIYLKFKEQQAAAVGGTSLLERHLSQA